MRAMFNKLARIGTWKKENPLEQIRQFKVVERELSYLKAALINAEDRGRVQPVAVPLGRGMRVRKYWNARRAYLDLRFFVDVL